MALPDSVNTVYAEGSQVLSDDLNDLQEQIVADHEPKLIPAINGAAPNGSAATVSSTARYVIAGAAGATWVVSLPVTIGRKIDALRYYFERVSGDQSWSFRRIDVTDGTEEVLSLHTYNSATGFQSSMSSGQDHTVEAGFLYQVVWTSGHEDDLFLGIKLMSKPEA